MPMTAEPPIDRPSLAAGVDDSGVGRRRQAEIYREGVAGRVPAIPTRADRLARLARQHMSERAWAYVAGAAGEESTMLANREALDRVRIVPRMLRDVSTRDTTVELFGRTLPSPLLLGPVGASELCHPDADAAVARAAAAEGVPMVFSNQASVPMEECARQMGSSPRWFQLYWSTEDRLVESLVRRAEAAGCEAIVLTLDTTMLGWRTRDLDLGYLPFLYAQGLAQYTSDPVFQELLDAAVDAGAPDEPRTVTPQSVAALVRMARNVPGNTLSNITRGRALAAVRQFAAIYSRPSLSWEHLSFLRELTDLPILLKGIMHVEDAVAAVEHGMDGVIVSNHGGRQVDGALGALDALEPIVDAIGNRSTVLFDSGIRSGADVFKALAIGARAVLIARPWAFGLAIDGERGVRDVIRNLHADFDLTMALAGTPRASDIGRSCLAR